MKTATILAALLLAASATAQIRFDVHAEKEQYLAGEPIFTVIQATNLGAAAVGVDDCVVLDVPNGPRRARRDVFGCLEGVVSGEGGSWGCGATLVKPGESATLSYLLRGYRLTPGEWNVRVTGRFNKVLDATVHFRIVAGGEESLRMAFEPYLKHLTDYRARSAIIEMAPPYLEKTIASFEDGGVVEALAEINTPESRKHLRDKYAGSNASRRQEIVRALTFTGARDNWQFFLDLLPDVNAYAGIGRIGGADPVEFLRKAGESRDGEVQIATVRALGASNTREAVPALIDLWARHGDSGYSCTALATLTHLHWCDHNAPSEDHAPFWKQWWQAHGAEVAIYPPEPCPDFTALRPLR